MFFVDMVWDLQILTLTLCLSILVWYLLVGGILGPSMPENSLICGCFGLNMVPLGVFSLLGAPRHGVALQILTLTPFLSI